MTGLANICQQSLRKKLYICTISNSNINGGKFRQFGPWMLVKLFEAAPG
jgi:hypothetical protein